MDVFAQRNKKWILSVGKDFFDELDVQLDVYLKEIIGGVCKFDAMAILLCCVAHNIHIMVLLHHTYWTMRCAHEHLMTQVEVAYVGDGNFKFIMPMDAPLQSSQNDPAVKATSQEDAVDASNNDDTQSDIDDLVDAGLIPDDAVTKNGTERPRESESDASTQKTMDDSHANDFLDEDIDNMDVTTEKQDMDIDNPNDDDETSETGEEDQDIDNPNDNDETSETGEVDQDSDNTNDDNVSSDTEASEKADNAKKKVPRYDNQGYVSDESDVLLVGISVPDNPAPSISGKVY